MFDKDEIANYIKDAKRYRKLRKMQVSVYYPVVDMGESRGKLLDTICDTLPENGYTPPNPCEILNHGYGFNT